jgi:hypothetical protein
MPTIMAWSFAAPPSLSQLQLTFKKYYMKSIYNERLAKFGEHISQFTKDNPHYEMGLTNQVELVALEERVRIHYKVLYHEWIFEELPVCFDEWYYDEQTGNPLYEGCDPKEGTVAAVIDFFNLSLDEFGHLFDIEGFQLCNRFGGAPLTINSHGIDVAQNISELLKRRKE